MPHVLDALLSAFRETAAGLPDRREGRSNKRYEVSDAAGCAPACFFTRCESLLAFQRRMERDGSRSNCRTLCGAGRIPCDHRIRNLLDDLDPAACDPLFRPCLATVAAQGALEPFQHLDERLPAAPDGVRFHRSDTVHGPQCSVRRVGSERRPHHFHAMADGHATVLLLMPEFVRPQQDAAATRADMSEDERKRDCERNAAKRWLAARGAWLQACRPVLPGDDLHCCQPVCEAAAAAGMDCIRVGKPGSRKRLYEVPESRRASGAVRSTGGLPRRGKGKRSERHRFRRTAAVPLRQGRDALRGTWIEYAVERDGKRTCASSFFAGLAVTADNAERIARAGRARWKIENEGCNCLARHGRNCKRNFGHGKDALANVPAVPNLFAFALHAVVQCVGAVRLRAAAAVPAPAGHAPRPVPGAAGRAALVPLPGPADAAGGGARRTRAAGLPAGRGLDSAQLRAGSVRRAAGRQSRLPPECVRSRARQSADPRRGPRHGPASRPTLPRGGLGSATSRSTDSPHPPKQRSRTPLTAKFRTAEQLGITWLDTDHELYALVAPASGLRAAGAEIADRIIAEVRRAGYAWERAGAGQMMASVIGHPPPTSDAQARHACTVAALLVLNSCLLYKRLHSSSTEIRVGLSEIKLDSRSRRVLALEWQNILERDYRPVFAPALACVRALPKGDALTQPLERLMEFAEEEAETLNELGYDHAGPLYHKILPSAASSGSFYTKPTSAMLLAALALPSDPLYRNLDAVRRLNICDPACGSGTLLMATLSRVKALVAEMCRGIDTPSRSRIHQILVENSLCGMDIDRVAIQLAACNLTLGAPMADYKMMHLYTLDYGMIGDRGPRAGRIELLEQPERESYLRRLVAPIEGF